MATAILDVECDWKLSPVERSFPRSSVLVASVLPEALDAACGCRPSSDEHGRWQVTLVRPTSALLFDRCSVALTIQRAAQESPARVGATVSFDSSPARVAVLVALAMSGLLLPLAHGWAYASRRSARSFARGLLDRIWREIALRDNDSPYR